MWKSARWILLWFGLLVGMSGSLYLGAISFTVPVKQEERKECQAAAKQAGNEKPDCPAYETVWQRGMRDPVAYYTLWITWFTGALVILGLGQGFLAIRQIALAQSSLGVSEKALTGLERPYLFVFGTNWRVADKTVTGGLDPGITYTIANYGRGPAIVKTGRVGFSIDGSIPTDLSEIALTHSLLTSPVIASEGDPRTITELIDPDERGTMEFKLKNGEIARIPTGLILGGAVIKFVIEYDGPITHGHEIESCWRWDGAKGAFAEFGGWQHNRRT